jgi:hypothetical protein
MTKSEYMARAFEAYNSGKITEEAYEASIQNADIFCDDEYEGNLPKTYAELDYADQDSMEAHDGECFDDLNYMRYMER